MRVRQGLPALLLLVPLVLLFLDGASQSGPSESRPPRLPQNAIEGSFHIFAAPHTPPTPTERGRLSEAIERYESAARLLQVHRVETTHGRLWVILTERFICLHNVGGTACAPKHQAAKNGVVLGLFSPPDQRHAEMHDFLVQGLAPNRYQQALLVINNQRHTVEDVDGNIFSVSANKPIHLKRLLPWTGS